MNTRARRSLGVIALAAVTAWGAHVITSDTDSRAAQQVASARASRLFDCEAQSGAPLGIVLTQGNDTITLERSQDHDAPTRWNLTTPIQTMADDAMVDAFVDALCALHSLGSVRASPGEPALEMSLFGLAPPAHEVSVSWDGKLFASMATGTISGFNNNLYVIRPASTQVEQVDAAFNHHLQRRVAAWRQKRLFMGLGAQDVQSLEVRLPNRQGYTLQHRGDQGYVVTDAAPKSETLPADTARVRALFALVADVRAENFVSEQASDVERKRFGMAKPVLTLTMVLRDGQSRSLTLGHLQLAQQQHYFAQTKDERGPIVRLASEELYTKLSQKSDAFQDLRVVHVDFGQVQKVVVTGDGETLHFARTPAEAKQPGVWQLMTSDNQPADAAVDQSRFVGNLQRLTQMRAASIITRRATTQALQEAGLLAPAHTLALMSADDRPLAIIWVGHSANGQVLVTDDQKQIISSIYEGSVEAFGTRVDAYLTAPAEAR